MKSETDSPSRRTLLTAGAAAIGATAVAAPVAMAGTPPMSDALARALDAHIAAQAAIDAAEAQGYGGDLGDLPEHLCDAEFDARLDLAEIPVATEGELLQKLRHLFDHECRMWGGNWDSADKFGAVLVALDIHFNRQAQS